LLRRFLLLKFGEQDGTGISEAVKRSISAFVKRNEEEPEQRLAEVAAIKEASPIHHDHHQHHPHHCHTNNSHDDDDDDDYDDNNNNYKDNHYYI